MKIPPPENDNSVISEGRGLVSPHIDYLRGGPTYAQVWTRAAEMVKGADLAVILGTDHFGEKGRITLRNEHSVELAAVWLHYLRGGKAIEHVPILCGAFSCGFYLRRYLSLAATTICS